MATLEKRGRSFRIIFRYAGVRYAKALSTRDSRAAKATMSRLDDNLHRLELGTLEMPADADVAAFLLGDGRPKAKPQAAAESQAKPGPLTLTGLFADYWSKLPAGSLEATTIAGMKIHQRQLEKYFGKTFTIAALTLGDLQGYVEKRSHDDGLRGRKVTAETIRKGIVTLRTVWNWARHHGHFEKPYPSKGLKFPKGVEKPPFMTVDEVIRRTRNAKPAEAADLWECAFLTLAEIDELLRLVKAGAKEPCVYPLFVFAAHTGARRSEIARSRPADLDFENNLVTIHERKKSHSKRTTRRVPMSPLLRQVLTDVLREHPGVETTFWHELPPTRGHNRIPPQPLDADTMNYHFKRALAKSKWDKLRGWHVFRHSFCSNCAAKGIDQRVINAWVGHQTEEMVRRYRHLLPDQQQAAINLVFDTKISERQPLAS